MLTVLLSALLAGSALPAHSPPQRWAPAAISSNQFESHAAFDPLGGDLYFVRSTPSFTGWRILTSRCDGKGTWTPPRDAPFAGDGVEADPWFTPDGKHLYFISTRSTDGIRRKDLDIWRVDRIGSTAWGKPERLPAPVNSTGNEWFPRLAADGWLYFGSDRAGGMGKTDIWRARMDGQGGWHVENAGAALNTAGDEYEPLPSPDGRTMILMADGGLYVSHLTNHAWSPRMKLEPDINANGSEIGALWSPSGRSLMFSRDIKGALSGELFVTHFGSPESWPPACAHADEDAASRLEKP